MLFVSLNIYVNSLTNVEYLPWARNCSKYSECMKKKKKKTKQTKRKKGRKKKKNGGQEKEGTKTQTLYCGVQN